MSKSKSIKFGEYLEDDFSLLVNIKSMNLESRLVFLQKIMAILVMTKESAVVIWFSVAKKVVLNSMNMQLFLLFVPLLLQSNISVFKIGERQHLKSSDRTIFTCRYFYPPALCASDTERPQLTGGVQTTALCAGERDHHHLPTMPPRLVPASVISLQSLDLLQVFVHVCLRE